MDLGNGSYALKDTGVKVVVGTTCCLAMLGSLFILTSFSFFKSLRSQARQILVNLSLMDFGIAISNMTGIAANFDYYLYYNKTSEVALPIEQLCIAQACIAAFFTYGSILWTIALAIYMYLLVFQIHRYPMRCYMIGCYVFCYGISTGMSLWLLLTKRVGYAPYNSSGWCGIIINSVTGTDYFLVTIGYDLWVYLAIVICVTVYLALFFQLKFGYAAAIDAVGSRTFWLQALHFLDHKLLLIPLGFVFLRMWTCIINILFAYIGVSPDHLPQWLANTLIYLSGIGDSGQGLVNGLIFVFLTEEVRHLLFGSMKRCQQWCMERENFDEPVNISPSAASNSSNERAPLLRGHRNLTPSPVADLLTPPGSLSITGTPQQTRK